MAAGRSSFEIPRLPASTCTTRPYTYFTSDDLHLGEISLECSRAGAAAGALWLTSRVFPFTPAGLGAGLDASLRAARKWEAMLHASEQLELCQRADLSIVTYFPSSARSVSEVDSSAGALLDAGMYGDDPVFGERPPRRGRRAARPSSRPAT